MLCAAAEACLAQSARPREDIDLVMHTGTYRTEFLCEPALAAIAAGELRINHDDEKLTGKRTFAFDLTNGSAGMLTGCFLASQLVGAGKYQRALLLASEVENNATHWPAHLLGVRQTASALLLTEGSNGFCSFAFRTFPEYVGCVESYTLPREGRTVLEHHHSPDLDALYASCSERTVSEFLAQVGMTLTEIQWFLLPQRSASFVAKLAKSMNIPAARLLLAPSSADDYFTSSLANAYAHANACAHGGSRVAVGDFILMVEVAAGIQTVCALYQA